MKNKIVDMVHDIILEPVADALRKGGEKLTGTEDVKTVLEKTKKFVQKSGINPADATVTAGDVLEGKTVYGSDGKKITGTIASKAAQTYTPGTVDQTIAAGQYLAGAQTVKGDANLTAGNIIKGKSIFGVAGSWMSIDTSDATATAEHIRKGKTAYGANGEKITGTIPNKAEQMYTPGTSDLTIAAGQYLTGAQIIKGDGNLKAGNIASGKSIFGVAGTLPGASTYYQCTAVSGDTWSGQKLVIDDAGNYIISDTVTSGLSCSGFTPEVGGVYLEDSRIFVADYWAKIIPTDTAFNLPLDATSHSGESVTLDSCGISSYCPRSSYLQHAKEIDGIKCLYLNDISSGGVYINTGGGLIAKDDTTANESTGCSARYGVGHPWTYSFWFYPDSATNIGEGCLFTLGYCWNSGWDRRLRLNYDDNSGAFLLFTDQNDSVNSGWNGSAQKQKWHHICVTGKEDARTFSLYVDGKYVVTLTHGSTEIPHQSYRNPDFWIGGTQSCPGNGGSKDLRHATGGYAKMKWYNRVLREGEIAALAEEITSTEDTPPEESVKPYGYRLKMSHYDLDPVWEIEFIQDDLTATGKARTWTCVSDPSSRLAYIEDFGGWTQTDSTHTMPYRTGFGDGEDPYPCWDEMEVAEITVIE